MFGTLVSPKLRSTQLSFETGTFILLELVRSSIHLVHFLTSATILLIALEMLVEISNVRASLLCAYDKVQKDRNGAK